MNTETKSYTFLGSAVLLCPHCGAHQHGSKVHEYCIPGRYGLPSRRSEECVHCAKRFAVTRMQDMTTYTVEQAV